jgi:hypothetical protein
MTGRLSATMTFLDPRTMNLRLATFCCLSVLTTAACTDDSNGGEGGSGGSSATGAAGRAGATAGRAGAGGAAGGGAGAPGGAGAGGAGGGPDGGAGAGGGPTAPLTYAEFVARRLAANCVSLVNCGRYSEQSACERFEATFVAGHLATVTKALEAGRATFDGAAAVPCLEAAQAQTACASPDVLVNECEGVLKGQVADGEPCAESVDCGDGSFCNVQEDQCPARCEPKRGWFDSIDPWQLDGCAEGLYASETNWGTCLRFVPQGGSCEPLPPPGPGQFNPPQECVPGSVCDGTFKCVPRSLPGESCGPGVGRCEFDDCVDGKCAKPAGLTEPCDISYGDDEQASCAWDLRCHRGDGAGSAGDTCGPPHGVGQPCSYVYQECDREAGLVCAPLAPLTYEGTCKPHLGLNEPCSDDLQCEAALQCSNEGRCRPRPGLNESCVDDGCAPGQNLYCDIWGTHVCLERKANGEACGYSWECLSSVCSGSTCVPPCGVP